jgi:glycosyltransferase involved in cell wall biosynthesis
MAQRRLVAASSVGGHRELITDGDTGTLFAPDDPAACAAALARLLDAREGWEAMKLRALAHVRNHHDWAINAGHYLSVYHLLLARSEGEDAVRIGRNAG